MQTTANEHCAVINGTVAYSTSLANNTQIKSMQGSLLTITILNGSVYVNSAKVVTPDVLVANGVVHVIDAYVLPRLPRFKLHSPQSS